MNSDWRGSQSSSRCPYQTGNAFELNALLSHNKLFCDSCRDALVLEKTKGEEILFANEQPYWIKSTNDCASNENLATNTTNVAANSLDRRKNDRKNRNKASERPDEPFKLAMRKLSKQGFSKEDALKKYIDEKRAKAPQKAECKKMAERNEMPWAPPHPAIMKSRVSIIESLIDHQRYVAILTNFLDLNQKPRYKQNAQELKIIDDKLVKEREDYQNLVMKSLENRKKPLYRCSDNRAIKYVLERIGKRASTLRGMYGPPIYERDSHIPSLDTLSRLSKKVLLHTGKMQKIVVPYERRRFRFSSDVDEISRRFPVGESNLYPLESDELAIHWAAKYGVHVVMGASSAIEIMCDSCLCNSSDCLLPVTVKRVFDENTGRFENICIVGKPSVQKSISFPSLWHRFIKYSIRLSTKGEQNTSAKTGGRQREKFNKIRKPMDIDIEENLVIDNSEETEIHSPPIEDVKEKNVGNSEAGHRLQTPTAARDGDILEGIISEMNTNNQTIGEFETCLEREDELRKHKGAALEKRYAIFSVGHDGTNDVDLLIRSNNDGIDGSGNSLAIVHKVEYAPEFGAEYLNDEQWLRDYFKCKFKCATQLLRFRVHNPELHLLQKERHQESMLTANRNDLLNLVGNRVKLLKEVALELESLQPGNYVIKKANNTLQILPEIMDTEKSLLDLSNAQIQIDKQLPCVKDHFLGIDEHLVLVYHIVQKRIPASFGPKRDNSNQKLGKRKGEKSSEIPPAFKRNRGGRNRNKGRNRKKEFHPS